MKMKAVPVDDQFPGARQRGVIKLPLAGLLQQLSTRLKIGPKLAIGFGILIVLMMVGYGWSISAGSQAIQDMDRTTNLRTPLTMASAQAQANWLRMEADVQAYLALGDQHYRINYVLVQQDFEKNLIELETILQQMQDQSSSEFKDLSRNLEEIRYHSAEWDLLVQDMFELRDDQLRREPALGILIVDAAPYINTIIVETTAIINSQKQQNANPESQKLLSSMYDFQSSFYAMIAGLRGYVTTVRPGFKFEYQANLDVNHKAWDSIRSRSELLTASQLSAMENIEAAREGFLAHPERMFQLVEGPDARADLRIFRVQAAPVSDRMLYLLDREASLQQDLLQSELRAGSRQLSTSRLISITSAVTAILAGLLLAWGISRDIARPILRLAGTAQRIQAGDLAAQAEATTQDEIGFLANAFNAMTAKLRETLQSLLDYLEQVKLVMSAAAAVEEDRFEPGSLDELSKREDALGQLARVFQKMAREVHLREEKLRQQVNELKIVLDEARQKKKVEEITGTDYFQNLRSEAEALRRIIAGDNS